LKNGGTTGLGTVEENGVGIWAIWIRQPCVISRESLGFFLLGEAA